MLRTLYIDTNHRVTIDGIDPGPVTTTIYTSADIGDVRLSAVTGINAKTAGDTTLYVNSGTQNAVWTAITIICTSAVALTQVPSIELTISSAGDVMQETILVGLTNTGMQWRYPFSGIARLGTPGSTLKATIKTPATATTMNILIDLNGYLR